MGVIDFATMAMDIPGRCRLMELIQLCEWALVAPPKLPIVELGTFQGRSTAMLCLAARQIDSAVVTIDNYTVDPVFTGGREPLPGEPGPHRPPEEYAELTRQNLARLGFCARIVIGDSVIIPEGIEEVGMLFIDSAHTAERFNAECDAWLPLMGKGSILACHDYKSTRWPEITPIIDQRFRGQMREWKCWGWTMTLIGFCKR